MNILLTTICWRCPLSVINDLINQHLDITWTNAHVAHAHNSLQSEPGLTASTQTKAVAGAVTLLQL